MRTARLLPVFPTMHCSWGGGYLPRGFTCLDVYLPGGVPAQGGVPTRGCNCPGTPPLWTEFLTQATENITLPQTSFAGGKNGMVTRGITYLVTKTFPAIVIENTFFYYLWAGRYLLPQAILNTYPPRCSNNNFFFPTSSWNTSLARHSASLVTHLAFGLCHDHSTFLKITNSTKMIC